MNITRHQSVLSCPEKRALRYQKYRLTLEQMDEVLYQEALDETGTVSIASLMESDTDSITLRENPVEWEEEGTVDIDEELLSVQRIAPGKKPDGVTRIIYENANRFNTRGGKIKRSD